MARKPANNIEPVEAAELDINKVHEIQNTPAKLEAAFSADQRQVTALINRRIGRSEITKMISKLLNVVDLLDLKSIKESKLYKGFQHESESGELLTISTWEEYCEAVEGRSRQAVDLDIQNLNFLGEDMFDALRKLGLGPGKMRDFRKLPEDQQQTLLEQAQKGDPDEVLALFNDMIVAERKRTEAAEKELSEVKADYEARGERLHKKNEELEAAQFALDRAEHRLKIATPDEQFAGLRDECHAVASRVEDEFRTSLTAALEALQEYGQANEEDLTPWMSSLILRMQRQLDAVRLRFGLPDVLEGEEPSWMNPDAVAAIEADVEARLASKEA